jgi:predicted transcriptional regulator of viral defense system
MYTKRTILSEKESILIEDLIAKYGIILHFDQIQFFLKDKMGRQAVRNLISKLAGNGWLIPIKKGLYTISSMESRGFPSISVYKTAQLLAGDSYVSFEAALQYYGMFDQSLKTVTSVSMKQRKSAQIGGINYKFVKTRKELFFGYEEKRVENYLVNMAMPEKAMLDILNFSRNVYYVDLVRETLEKYKEKFNLKRLNEYALRCSGAVQKILGFLFDKTDINSDLLYNLVKEKQGSRHMTADSKIFNAKWRLYCHERLR